ncbi:glycoside hydrolase family 95-like protein [Acidobacteriota bacterium]
MKKCRFYISMSLFLFSLLVLGTSCQQDVPGLEERVDWPEFMKRQDPQWEALPEKWYDAPFLGNGQLGTLIRKIGEKELRWDVGQSFVHDHREPDDYSVRSPEILNRGRLPIGFFVLRTRGRITGGTIRLDLWNAEARGTIVTEEGDISWRTFVHAEDMAFLVELIPAGGETEIDFDFVPARAESSRVTRNRENLTSEFLADYTLNPAPRRIQMGSGIAAYEQPLAAGGQTTTAWISKDNGNGKTVFVTCQHSFPGPESSEIARTVIQKTANTNLSEWMEVHRVWWHDYYTRSFLSLDDPIWESFYWIQMYKLACATRRDRALIDNQGPWLQPTPWNGTWWNLNVQLSYSPVPASNRLELGQSLINHLKENIDNLIDNVEEEFRADSAGLSRNTSMLDLKGRVGRPGGWEYPNPDIGSEVGNLTWICHNLYTFYRSGGDESLLRDVLYPLLKRAVNYYRHFFIAGPDRRWHLPSTHSPEFGNVPDCNYDLGLIRWGCQTLIEIAQKLDEDADMIPLWEEIQEKLVEFPVNENGFMVGTGQGFDRSHRHWSHLLMIYPLRLVNPENGGEEIIRRSLDWWHSFKGALAGYSFTAGASIAALLGEGERTLEYLNGFLPYMGASTMYYEGGEAALPVMETPLHASSVIQEMLLQSWGDRIRVFPAVPDTWLDINFHNLRAEGAFLVSAARREGQTKWVRIQSLAGESCLLKVDMEDPVVYLNGSRHEVNRIQEGLLHFTLARGDVLILRDGGFPAVWEVFPVRGEGADSHFFGLKKNSDKEDGMKSGELKTTK